MYVCVFVCVCVCVRVCVFVYVLVFAMLLPCICFPMHVLADPPARYIDRHQIDYIVHGDDPCFTPDGRDVCVTCDV